ncbi:hypothetical protein JCM19235_6980 [Vibrio maritimus]|uniref:Uncharacterized protein n=1 Tax=Vibrio maritimus TaxID=990268 RepID=A0A090S9Z4_9VIBR|nr:hypothetical protein JCM19235_6980 [Vibrio maritimus]
MYITNQFFIANVGSYGLELKPQIPLEIETDAHCDRQYH